MSRVFIGMPVYNGEQFIERAISSIREQSYKDWRLLISDNASTDRTSEICKKISQNDSRIEYYRQDKNFGALENFRFFLGSANCEYFMWAAADDMWDDGFVAACVNILSSNNIVDYAFTGLVNIDSYDNIIRYYPWIKKYFNPSRSVAITDFILDPECYGKANLIYGMYRYHKVKNYLSEFLSNPINDLYAFDIALNLGIICRFHVGYDERILFKKRFARLTDDPKVISPHFIRQYPIIDGMDPSNFSSHRKAIAFAILGTEYSSLVSCLMDYRAALVAESYAFRKKSERCRFSNLICTKVMHSIEKFISKFCIQKSSG